MRLLASAIGIKPIDHPFKWKEQFSKDPRPLPDPPAMNRVPHEATLRELVTNVSQEKTKMRGEG
jgi:hypothetical protein